MATRVLTLDHGLEISMKQAAWQDPLGSTQPGSPFSQQVDTFRDDSKLPEGQDGLIQMAAQGSWHAIEQRVRAVHIQDAPQLLTNASWLILSLVKLRQYTTAAEELKKLGDLDAQHYTTQRSGRPASLVPFALRWLQADLPERLGSPAESQELQYALLHRCQQEATSDADLAATARSLRATQHLHSIPLDDVPLLMEDPASDADLLGAGQAEAPPATPAEAHVRLWTRRQHAVASALASRHLRQKEFMAALRWLDWLLRERGDEPELWARVMYVQLGIGDIAAAEQTILRLAALLQASQNNPKQQLAARLFLRRHEALVLFARQDYPGALSRFEHILQEQPRDSIASNGRALCHMYACNLQGAIQCLEGDLQQQPHAHLKEPILANLCSMYELSTMATNSAAAKQRLAGWAAHFAPDDFDITCTRTA